MIWTSGKLNMEVVKSIITDIVKDRQRYSGRNLSCQPGANPNKILKEIIDSKVYENDYTEVTSQFVYKMVEYSVASKSLMEILERNIIPSHIESFHS